MANKVRARDVNKLSGKGIEKFGHEIFKASRSTSETLSSTTLSLNFTLFSYLAGKF